MRVMVVAVAMALSTACGAGIDEPDRPEGEDVDRPEQVFPDRDDDRDQRRVDAEAGPGTIVGTFGGSAELEGGCFWVDADPGRYEVVWPDGYTVETDPVRLLRDGDVVAEAGDTVVVHGAVDTDAMSVCQIGPVLRATGVDVR
jgi:hypothetical protein